MKVCTLNVNSINARKDLIIEWMKHRENDIEVLCFQELKAIEENFPYQDFEKLGYSCAVSGQKGYNGVAICSKFPMERRLKDSIEEHWDEQKRVIAANIGGIDFLNIYGPHGDLRGVEKFHYKIDWYQKLLSFIDENYSTDSPLIVLGDFNVAREDKDLWSPELLKDSIGTMPEEREALKKILGWGFIDAFRSLYPDKKQFTWWDYIGGDIWRDQGMRIDYILCTEALVNKLKDVEVDLWPRRRRTPKPSDHAPVVGTFDIPSRKEGDE